MKYSDILAERMLEKNTPANELIRNGVVNIDDHKFMYEAKVYRFASTIGINNGRIVKLKVFNDNNKVIIEYDHEWCIKPVFNLNNEVLDHILDEFKT